MKKPLKPQEFRGTLNMDRNMLSEDNFEEILYYNHLQKERG